jgi:hypothetical protein
MGLLMTSIVILFAIALLFAKYKTSKRFLIFMAIFLLLYKSIEYTIYGLHLEQSKVPVEYSTLTYFLLSTYVIFDIKSLKAIASFMGFVSGLGYLIVFIFLADDYISHQGLFITMMAFVNHSICFLASILIMKNKPIETFDKNKIMMFTILYVVYVIIISKVITYTQSFIFIFILLDGDLLEFLIPQVSITAMDYLAYFLLIFILYQLFIKLFIKISHYVYKLGRKQDNEYTI